MLSDVFRVIPCVPFCEYGACAKTCVLIASSKKSCDVNSLEDVGRILKWMWTARPWYQPG